MDAQDHYRQQSIETASPGQLVSMLYHGAIAAVIRAEAQMEVAGVEQANRELQRAQDIVTELQVTLDHESGGGIARNLNALYTFCIERLVEANVSKRVELLAAVKSTLSELASGWDEMLAAQAPAAPAVEYAGAYKPAAAVG